MSDLEPRSPADPLDRDPLDGTRRTDAPSGLGPPAPGERRFSPGVTVFCLVAWLLVVAADKLAQLAIDPVASFERPAVVAIRATEGPLALADGLERVLGQPLEGAFSLEGVRSAIAATHDESRERIAAAAADGTLEVDEAALVELRARAAVLRALDGERPPLLEAEDLGALAARWPLIEAVAVAFGDGSTERPEALIEAAEGMVAGPARTALLEALGARLERTERTEPDLAAARAAVDARVERGIGLLGVGLPLALAGLVVLGLLLVLPARAVRLDPPDRPHRWPAFADGIGLFARYGAAFYAVQAVLAPTVGSAALGWSAAAASAPLLLVAVSRYGSPGAAAASLGGPLAHDRWGRLLALPLGAWIAALLGVAAVGLGLGGGATDPFANPFIELLSDGDGDLRLRFSIEACLWAPIFEELAFRAALFGGLRARLPFLPAAALSSVVFGAAHAYDAVGIASIVWVGFALAWLYERTRSIGACMLAHALFNFGQLQLAFLVFG